MIKRSSRNGRGHRERAALALALMTLAAGCSTETRDVRPALRPPPKQSKPPTLQIKGTPPPSNASNLDPCAMRLHDIAGSLFLYYFTYQKMPASLGELNTLPGTEQQVPLTCPTSGRPYVYSPEGILLAEQNARIIVYDSTPAHYGNYRWAIRMEDPRDNKPTVSRVVALPESFFTLRPPESAAP